MLTVLFPKGIDRIQKTAEATTSLMSLRLKLSKQSLHQAVMGLLRLGTETFKDSEYLT